MNLLISKNNRYLSHLLFVLCVFSFSFFHTPSVSAKELFKFNEQTINSEDLAKDVRMYLSQNLSKEQVEALQEDQLTNLTQSVLVKKYIITQATQDKDIQKSLEAGGNLNDAINRVRIDIISQAYLDKVVREAITDEMIDSQYEDLKTQLENAYEYDLEAIITASEEEAEKARNELVSGSLFSQVADKYSTDPQVKENRGSLGKVISFQIDPNLQEELKTLKPYEFSKVVGIGNNFSVVRYSSKNKPNIPQKDKVLQDIRESLVVAGKQQLVNDIVKQIKLEPVTQN